MGAKRGGTGIPAILAAGAKEGRLANQAAAAAAIAAAAPAAKTATSKLANAAGHRCLYTLLRHTLLEYNTGQKQNHATDTHRCTRTRHSLQKHTIQPQPSEGPARVHLQVQQTHNQTSATTAALTQTDLASKPQASPTAGFQGYREPCNPAAQWCTVAVTHRDYR